MQHGSAILTVLQAAARLRQWLAHRQHTAGPHGRWWQPGACQRTVRESAQPLLALEQVQECWTEPVKWKVFC